MTGLLVLKYAVCAICGVVFGVAIEKSRVHEAKFVRGQMDFSYLVMMKVFLGATAAGLLSMSLASMAIKSARESFQNSRKVFISSLKNKGYLSATTGGFLLGAGLTIAGACPGTALVQVGALTANSIYIVVGGLLGTCLYALTEPVVVRLTKPAFSHHHQTLDSKGRYTSVALPLAAMLYCTVTLLEYMKPWQSDVGIKSLNGGYSLSDTAWPPYICGAIIGSLQPVLNLTVTDTLGSSSGYCTIISQGLVTKRLRNSFPYLTKFKHGIANWWQVAYLCGVIVGGNLSSSASGNLYLGSPVTTTQALVGGAVMLYGARLASGCSSGHGLSGMALLVLNSYVAVCSMFAGAMTTRVAMTSGYLNI